MSFAQFTPRLFRAFLLLPPVAAIAASAAVLVFSSNFSPGLRVSQLPLRDSLGAVPASCFASDLFMFALALCLTNIIVKKVVNVKLVFRCEKPVSTFTT
jgi:hypothetical protein